MLPIFVGDRAGVRFVLQSGRYQPAYLYQRYLAFFTQAGQRLNTIDSIGLEQCKQGVIAQLKQKPPDAKRRSSSLCRRSGSR
ncbi:MAG: hypothetical protein ACTXOO_04565 [Sodalis sp. (in: enterobacteria)]